MATLLELARRGLFVTATDTGAGKTLVTCALLRLLATQGVSALAMKPVASGARRGDDGLRNADAQLLRREAGQALPYGHCNPYCYEPAIAPHLAARQAGEVIDRQRIVERFAQLRSRTEAVLVEGAGGWRVPLGDDWAMSDLAHALGLPVLVVVPMRLGAMNHALLTAEAIVADGVSLAGWVANGVAPGINRGETVIGELEKRMPGPLLGRIPWIDDLPSAAEIEEAAPAGGADTAPLDGWRRVVGGIASQLTAG